MQRHSVFSNNRTSHIFVGVFCRQIRWGCSVIRKPGREEAKNVPMTLARAALLTNLQSKGTPQKCRRRHSSVCSLATKVRQLAEHLGSNGRTLQADRCARIWASVHTTAWRWVRAGSWWSRPVPSSQLRPCKQKKTQRSVLASRRRRSGPSPL